MSYGEVRSFRINYPDMNNKHVDYKKHQILREIEYIKQGFICIKWGKTLKSGTRATYIKADDIELMKRIEQLRKEI